MGKRQKTEYKGVVTVQARNGDTAFYGLYKKPDGKRGEVSLGWEARDGMTALKAFRALGEYEDGNVTSGYDKRKDQREIEKHKLKTTWPGFWECYATHVDDNGKINRDKASNYGNVRIFRQHISPFFKSTSPHKVTEEDAKDFKQHILKMQYSDGFKRNIFELFKRVLRHNKNKNVAEVPLPKMRKKVKVRPTNAQVQRLMGILQVPQYPFNGKVYRVNRIVANCMLLMRYTGMRSIETRKLQWRDVDFEHGTILLREPKGGVDSTIPMSKKAREILQSQLPSPLVFDNPPEGTDHVFLSRNGGMMSSYVTAARQYCTHAGMPPGFAPCHGLRFLFASELNDKGVPLTYIQQLLTHKNITTTMRYIEVDETNLRNAANLID